MEFKACYRLLNTMIWAHCPSEEVHIPFREIYSWDIPRKPHSYVFPPFIHTSFSIHYLSQTDTGYWTRWMSDWICLPLLTYIIFLFLEKVFLEKLHLSRTVESNSAYIYKNIYNIFYILKKKVLPVDIYIFYCRIAFHRT